MACAGMAHGIRSLQQEFPGRWSMLGLVPVVILFPFPSELRTTTRNGDRASGWHGILAGSPTRPSVPRAGGCDSRQPPPPFSPPLPSAVVLYAHSLFSRSYF